MSRQTPTIGRVLLFCIGYDEQGALVERPARVVNVTKDGVNLAVDVEPTDDAVTIGDTSKGGSPVRAAVTGPEVARLIARRCDVQETTLDGPMVGCYRWPMGAPGAMQVDLTASPQLQKLFADFEERVGGNIREALAKIDPDYLKRLEALEGAVQKNADAAASLIEGLGGAAKEQIAHVGLRVDDLERKFAAGIPAQPAPVTDVVTPS